MKKIILGFLLLFAVLSACKKEKDVLGKLKVQITSEQKELNYSEFQIKVTEQKSQKVYEANANDKGIAEFSLPMGSYNILVENPKEGVSSYSGLKENFVLSKDETVSIKVELLVASLNKSFVLDELYFNGTKNGYMPTMYEQYFTIRNISDRPLYADGLSFGVCGDFNSLEELNKMNKLLPDIVVLSQFYTLPGDGRTYKVNPNESIIIAHSAINHKEGKNKEKSIDLSGAHFEIYVPHQHIMTTDNPEVPNVDVNFSTFEAFHWQYSGVAPMVLFRLDENPNTFAKNNKEKFANPASMGTMKQDFIKLPSKYIIDAVETGATEGFYHKVLPASVDKSKFTIPGSGMLGSGFDAHFIKRKEIIGKDGKPTVKDTNDSENDYELLTGGQKSYPKK